MGPMPRRRPGTGSSPRMRGKQYAVLQLLLVLRIIPAHAGQTWWSRRGSGRLPDHPRACGANGVAAVSVPDGHGSSPRMRGKRPPSPMVARSSRIIPAHAGQTVPVLRSSSSHSDHPRACGANLFNTSDELMRVGSSPRMRGKPRLHPTESPYRRIIPAHAGQTFDLSIARKFTSDHPRACGANTA